MTATTSRARTAQAKEPTDSAGAVEQATTERMTAEVMAELRKPFPDKAIGKLPRVTCKDCKESQRKRCDNHEWVTRCGQCQGSHTSGSMHIDYVGHAAVTDRLLAVDPEWTWEPMGLDANGLPMLDSGRNLWIRLTVRGVTRIGVGDATGDSSGATAKVLIGDALRNAAMRFGVALDLWSKADLGEVNPVTDPLFLAMVLDNIAEASTVAALQEQAALVRTNAGYLSKEDREKVNEAWIARRDKMGQPA